MQSKIKTKDFIRDLRNRLLISYDNQIDQANNIARYIVESILSYSSNDLIIKDEIFIPQNDLNKINYIIDRHVNYNMPIQYLFGTVDFLDLKLNIEPPILIPRQETEYWVYELINKIKKIETLKLNILDLCTGSGCITLAFAKEFKNSFIYAIDISQQACGLTRKNAEKNNINNIKIINSDLYNKLENIKFDIILSNPPYISLEQYKYLDPMVKDWEDINALVAEDNGLEIIKRIVAQSNYWLRRNSEFEIYNIPQLVLEIDFTQGQSVSNLLLNNGFSRAKIVKDLFGKDRVVEGYL